METKKDNEKTQMIQRLMEAIDQHCKDAVEVKRVIDSIYKVLEFIESQNNHPQDIILDLRHAKNIVAEYSDQKSLEAVQTASDELIAGMTISNMHEKEIDLFYEIYDSLNMK